MDHLNADKDFAETRDALASLTAQRRWERTKAEQRRDQLENSKGGHTPEQAKHMVADLENISLRGGVPIYPDKIEKIEQALTSQRPKHGRPLREQPAQPTLK
jgi:hypothetical protein